jgi:nucleoside-diphosphate-sugar epimerase
MEKIKTPHLLVIGGTGFIGHHVLKAASNKKWLTSSISLNPPSKEREVEGVRYIQLDLCQRDKVQTVIKNETYDYVVNLGGYIDHTLFKDGGRRLIESHFVGLQNLIENLNRESLQRFVQIGSSDEYGNSAAPQSEELREVPISPYSLAKVAATQFLQMLHRTEYFPATILRLFLTYGPGQNDQRFLPQIIQGCLADKKFPTSSGEQFRDFCYIDDTVEAVFQAFQNANADGEVFNVASGNPESIRKMIEQVCTLTNSGQPQFGAIAYRPGENMLLYADVNKIRVMLNWKPQVNLEEGLKRTIDWYK